MKKIELLIIDDERNTREGLKRALSNKYEVSVASNAKLAINYILEKNFDIVLTDLRMPELDGMNFLKRVNSMESRPICIMLTAYGSIENAVEAMKYGAYDFLTKPVNLDNLEIVIGRALESVKIKKENINLKRELASKYAFENIIGKSTAMQQVFDALKQIAPAKSTVLLTGESGTGKELAARALHQLSNRSDKPFITVHCAALSRNLLESELFGHEKGAFTGAAEQRKGRFESADGGTVFLDEIAEIDPSIQIILLRILENKIFERVGGSTPVEVDVRLIAATNKDLKKMANKGEFREDLYYRLDVLQIHMPALCERKDDIPLLLKYYLDVSNKENERNIISFSPHALELLIDYDWPGNVRELRNAVERMIVMARNEIIDIDDIPVHIRYKDSDNPLSQIIPDNKVLNINENEKLMIIKALQKCNGNRTEAAKQLGISRRTIIRKIKKSGLDL